MGPVNKLVVLSDGSLASASEDKTISIWSTELKRIRNITDHEGPVSSLQVISNGTLLVSSSLDRSVRIWNPKSQTGRPEREIAGLLHPVGGMAVLNDNLLAITYQADNQVSKSVYILNLVTGNIESTISGHSGTVTTLTVLPNGHLATGSIDRTVKIWDVPRRKLIETLAGHSAAPSSIEVLSDGQLVSSSGDEVITWSYYLGARCEFVGTLTTDNLRCLFGYTFGAETLELNSKQIRSISPGAFALFKKARKLELGVNQLSQLEVGAFAGLTEVDTLNLFDNQLTSLDGKVFENLSALRTLNLKDNRLGQLPKELFKYAPRLTSLDLQKNQISDLDVSLFEQVCLRTLRLEDNPVESFLEVKFNGKCVQVFDKRKYTALTQSLLTSLGYENKDRAMALEIRNKNINSISPNAFDGYRNTRILDLGSNSIEKFSVDQFRQMESLEELSLAKNQLATLPGLGFSGLTNLVEVRVNGNFLTRITEEMFAGLEESVERIDLRDNQISTIDKDSFRRLKKLKRVYLKGNPVAPPGSNVATLSEFYCGQRCLLVV